MSNSMITVSGPSGESIPAYLSLPPLGFGPGIAMAHDIHGNSALNRELADDLAAFGYVVLMPDLFFDLEPEMVPDATGQPSPRYLGRFDRARCFGLFASGIEALRRRPECNGKVGVIGFCEGGNHALLSATRLRVDAAVSY